MVSFASVKLLGISGSLRRDSYCTSVLRTLQENLDEKAALSIFDLRNIPLYNQDEDGDLMPQPVRDMKQAIADADGVILVSPEYSCGMSGVMKNALDWASRPFNASPLYGKPFLIMTASPASTGGARAQVQLLDCLFSNYAHVVQVPQVVIGQAHKKIVDGRLTDEVTVKFALSAVDGLLKAIGREKAA
jgi:chromate reductase